MPIYIAIFTTFLALASYAQELITLTEGDSWTQPAVGKAWIEDGSVIQVAPDGGKYLFRALKSGQTEVHVGSKVFWISILSRQQNRTHEILVSSSKKTLGLSVKAEDGMLLVRGALHRFEDWEVLANSCIHKKCNYRMTAAIEPALQTEIQSEFDKKLKAISAFPYRIEFGDHVTLHLPPKFPQAEQVAELLSRYGVDIIPDTGSIEMQPLVKVQITVAEIKRQESLKYGIKWPDSYNAQILPSVGGIDPVSLNLQAMEINNVGKVLASPNILCRSGKEAEFVAGGEFPIKIINFKLQDIVWKKYGILLRVKPVADFSGRMSISIETEVSSIDNSLAVDGIPAMFTNRLQSHFDLTSPQTIALSGLLKHDSSEGSQGLPGLSRIPILGALFSSKDYINNKTELVILVRPEIVQPQGAL